MIWVATLTLHNVDDPGSRIIGRQADKQPLVAAAVAEQIAAGEKSIVGVMIESNLVCAKQCYQCIVVRSRPLVYSRPPNVSRP